MIRQPSDPDLYWHYWRLALVDPVAAEKWRLEHDAKLSFSDQPHNYGTAFPGFFRKFDRGPRSRTRGLWLPIAAWIESPKDDDGNLAGDEFIVMKIAHGKPFSYADSVYLTWSGCFREPVTEAAYRFAMLNNFRWADDRPPPARRSAPVELTETGSLFRG